MTRPTRPARLDGSSMPLRSQQQQGTDASLDALPDELIRLILEYLSTSDLRNISLVSKWASSHAVGFLWKHVNLVDCWKLQPRENGHQIWGYRGQGDVDEHDDTPMLQRLFLFASNPYLASKVQTITHRCHLPTPAIFTELPILYFHGPTLSQDPRTLKLLKLAIRNLVNVHTLRIIYGHHHIVKGLLEGFLDPDRPRQIPLRRLWLESCSLLDARICFAGNGEFDGLESVRFRRLRAESLMNWSRKMVFNGRFPEYRLARGGVPRNMHNGAGGHLQTTLEYGEPTSEIPAHIPRLAADDFFAAAQMFDKKIYQSLPEVEDFVANKPLPDSPRTNYAPRIPMIHILDKCSRTLTKLNLDWILWRKHESISLSDESTSFNMLQQLSTLRFPNLRAFQLRNAVVHPTRLPNDIYLLEPEDSATPCFLDFLEAHPKLQCLSWPADRFYSHRKPLPEVSRRAREVVAHLGGILVELRVDSYYEPQGERFTDMSTSTIDLEARARRRRFVSEFVPFMTKLEILKIEGGVPRDEKREIIRALHSCPLQKIVLIGVSCPIGNTWGLDGEELRIIDEGLHEYPGHLEEEDKAAIAEAAGITPAAPEEFTFTAEYGWPPSPPIIHTIAAHHASTITELKFCGYNGSPILTNYTPITPYMLYPIRHFHNLEQLVISMWLLTSFEDSDRDDEIIASWLDARSPSSTALITVTPPVSPPATLPGSFPEVAPTTMTPSSPEQDTSSPGFNRWAVALKTKYSPAALAYRVAADIGPHLSDVAKARPRGVRVRASFCLGTETGDIFDLDIRVGRDNRVLEFVGPREEGESGRWRDKLEGRRWF